MGDPARGTTAVQWRRRLVALLGAASGGAVLLALLLLTYLLSADLGRHRGRIERLLSDALGYEVRIGELHIDLALRGPARLEASGVTLLNPTWSGEPILAEIDRLSVAVELRPLLGQTVVVRDLEVRGGRVSVEVAGDGRTNWSLPPSTAEPPDGPALEIPLIVINRAVLNEVRATLRVAAPPRPIVIDAARLELATDPSDMLQLHLAGALDEWPLDLAGTIGPVAELVIAGDVRPDLRLAAGDATLTVRGRIADLMSLQGIDATLTAEGPEIDDLTERLGLPSLGGGPFRLSVAVRPADRAVGIDLDAALGDLTASARGVLDSLTNPGRLDLTVAAAGPSLAAAAALRGLHGMPDAPFRLAGRIAWDGFPLTLEEVSVRVGENRLDLDGVVGEPPAFPGTALRVEGEGPDLSAIAALLGIDLPRLSYRVAGRLEESDGSLLIDDVEARIGDNRLEVAGKLGELPGLSGTDLEIHARGPGLAPFRHLTGLDLPDEPFDLRARIVPLPDRLRLEQAVIRLGSTEAHISGTIATGAGFSGTRLRVQASGDDLSSLSWAHTLDDLPPAPFRISGAVRVDGDAVELDRIEVDLGDLDLSATGRVVMGTGLDGSEMAVEVAGRRLSDVEAFGGPRGLPDAPFAFSGTVRVEGGNYRLSGIRASIRGHEIGVDGLVVPAAGLAGSSVAITLAGPDLGDLGRLVADFSDLPPLPEEPYSVSGSVAIDPDGFDLRAVVATLGRARASIDGRLGAWPGLRNTDLTIDLDGPDASHIQALLEFDLPVAPFELRGRLRRHDSGAQIDDLTIRLGDNHLWLDGSIGEPPQMIGSDFRFRTEGPDLAMIGRLAEKDHLPPQPYRLEGHAQGSPSRFRVDDLALQIGESDVRGYLRLQLEGRKALEGRLESDTINLLALLPVSGDDLAGTSAGDALTGFEPLTPEDDARGDDDTPAGDEAPTPGDDEPTDAPAGTDRRFGDEPFDLSRLDRFDADVGWRISRVRAASQARDLEINLRLDHGRLRIGPFEAVGERGGRVSGSLRLEPHGGSYDLAVEFNIDDGWADLTGSGATAREDLTHIDARINLHSRGATPHEVAAGAEGYAILFLEGGRVDDSLLSINMFSVLRRLLNLINPFADASEGPAELECAAFILDFDESVMRLDPMAIRTQNVTIIGRGGIDFDSEQLNLEWVAKPRKGIGISATTLTNPYIKLGGTLTRPRVDVKPVQAVTSTSLAVATGGLSLLGRGLWDRVTAEKKVCKKARKEAARRLAGKPPRE